MNNERTEPKDDGLAAFEGRDEELPQRIGTTGTAPGADLLNKLLAESDSAQPLSLEDREWLDAPSVGRERL